MFEKLFFLIKLNKLEIKKRHTKKDIRNGTNQRLSNPIE